MDPHNTRPERAARYWASRPGNHHCFAVFNYEDALQEARLGLLANPSATWAILYRRVLDAARRAIPGYRQREVPVFVALDDVPDRFIDCTAERLTLLHERAAILDALPDSKRALAAHWVDGETDDQAGARYGVKGPAWCARRWSFFKELRAQGL